MTPQKRKAVFLDRDGVINKEVDYAHRIDQLHLLPRTALALKKLNQAGFLVVVITNQAGVAYGFYSENQVHIFHDSLQKRLEKQGGNIDAFYFCPHHKTKGQGWYKVDCKCRKPKTGLFKQAARELEIDFAKSFAIGDKCSDLEPAAKLGSKTILVLTGHGKNQLAMNIHLPKHTSIAKNLYQAVTNYILKKP
jgi:D-glycero-D-manno-heptose 1,7-bisphosphate phosphatase